MIARLPAAIVCACLGAAAAGFAADPQAYTVTLVPSGDRAVDAAIAASSSLNALRKTAPVGPFALISRAGADAERFVAVLHSEGFYDGRVEASIDGRALIDPQLPSVLDAGSGSVVVTMHPVLGPRFTLGQVRIEGRVPDAVRAGFSLHTGQSARAAPVLAAGTALLAALQDDGYALARVPAPVAIEHPGGKNLDIIYTVDLGPRVDIGAISLSGLGRVKADFVRRRMLLHRGERYNPDRIEAARQDLAGLPVFSSVRAEAAETVDGGGQLPLAFRFTERKRHVVSLGVAYSTDLGGSANVSWTDRDVFGRAEQLILSASATELGGSVSKQPGYNVSASFQKPDWLHRDQTLQFDAIALREYLISYDRTAFTVDTLVSRKLVKQLSVNVGVSATEEQVTQEFVTRNYTFVGLPLGVKYDTTDSLLAPIRGFRVSATVTPTESFGGAGRAGTYVLLAATGSTYLNFGRPGRSVLALRATVGATEGATQFALPPDQRQYAGGSATIRGYKYQYVGPQFADGTPQGGTSLDAVTAEFRQRFGRSFGAAVFADTGQVGASGLPGTGSLRAGVGVGGRYYTAIGPIRLDVAVPVIRQQGAGVFEAYIGIGEAF